MTRTDLPVAPPARTGLGSRTSLPAELLALGDTALSPARVLAQHRGFWLVQPVWRDGSVADGPAPAGAPRLVRCRRRLLGDAPLVGGPVTGDWVALDADGAIAAVLERRGTVVRHAAGKASGAQVLAANVELALVVEPFPEPNPRRAERMVALAAGGGVGAAVVLTKADLDPVPETTSARATAVGERAGVRDALAVSAPAGEGLDAVRALLAPGATAVLLGPSGAGKSTLANALLGMDLQATAEVRSDGRGRHTTVTRELLSLPWGTWLIDTPGIREAGMWEGPGDAFADVEALAADCRFSDCAHDREPGCAVRGAIDPDRLESWRALTREQAAVEARGSGARERERGGGGPSRRPPA